jgi:hypothetical protein
VKRNDRGSSIEDRLRMSLDIDLVQIREGVDMSAKAVTQRLIDLGQMSTLCLSLRRP